MKRVLIMSYYWPPAGGSGVQRWVKFAKYLPQEGWQPVIYTPSNPTYQTVDHSLEADIPPDVEVIRTPIREPYAAYRRFDRKTAKEVNPIHGGRKTLKQKIALFIRANFFIPDPRVSWVRPSVKFLKSYLAEHPVDALITTGPPHSIHLIGKKLSRETSLPWIADFRDPWTDIFYFKHLPLCAAARKRHDNLEMDVLDGATAVVAVSPLVRDDFARKTLRPVHLITNGYDEQDYIDQTMSDGFFNIVHTGQFSKEGIPDRLWEVLGDIKASDPGFAEKLRIRLVGQTDPEVLLSIEKASLGDNLVNLGYRRHWEAVREQQASSLLILPLRKDPEYRKVLPGKLFEYLASGRPVLGIGQSDGAMARVLDDAGAGITCNWDDGLRMKDYILTIWAAFREGRTLPRPAGIERYSRRAISLRYANLLNSITER